MIELLVVVSIIVLLAAIVSPVTKTAVRAAQISHSQGNLRQQHLALKLYQENNGGDGVYGSWADMNMPISDIYIPKESRWPDVLAPGSGSHSPMWRSACATNPYLGPSLVHYWAFFPSRENAPLARRFQENLVMFGDLHCNDSGVSPYNLSVTKLGLGVLLSGQLVKPRKIGRVHEHSWWSEPPADN